MTFTGERGGGIRRRHTGRSGRLLLVCVLLLGQAFFSPSPYAAEVPVAGTYQLVAGSGDNAYLFNTETGMVWVLTYRTMATGREPVAIPYKFIGISPQSQGDFLVEPASVMPAGPRERK